MAHPRYRHKNNKKKCFSSCREKSMKSCNKASHCTYIRGAPNGENYCRLKHKYTMRRGRQFRKHGVRHCCPCKYE